MRVTGWVFGRGETRRDEGILARASGRRARGLVVFHDFTIVEVIVAGNCYIADRRIVHNQVRQTYGALLSLFFSLLTLGVGGKAAF